MRESCQRRPSVRCVYRRIQPRDASFWANFCGVFYSNDHVANYMQLHMVTAERFFDIDRANRIVLANPVFQAFRKQRALPAIRALNEAPHSILPRIRSRESHSEAFSHSQGQNPNASGRLARAGIKDQRNRAAAARLDAPPLGRYAGAKPHRAGVTK